MGGAKVMHTVAVKNPKFTKLRNRGFPFRRCLMSSPESQFEKKLVG